MKRTLNYSQLLSLLLAAMVLIAVSCSKDTVKENPEKPLLVGQVTSLTGKVWMDRNLGASRVATSSTDEHAYGDLYQWGRLTDGHQIRTSTTTGTISNLYLSGHGSFILTSYTPWDWLNPQKSNLWQGVNGTNNPCPKGFRLPTDDELNAEQLTWSSNNATGAFASPLKLTVAGYRKASNGSLTDVGAYGYYWSSKVDVTTSRYLSFASSGAGTHTYIRAGGFSVRCIKD